MLPHRCTSADQLKHRIASLKRAPLPTPSRDPDPDPRPALQSASDEGGSISGSAPSSNKHRGDAEQQFTDSNLTDSLLAAWSSRTDQLRDEEWAIGLALLRASRLRLRCVLSGAAPKSALAEAARFADLGSRLARRAITVSTSGKEEDASAGSAASDRRLAEYEEAINQIVEAHNASKKTAAGTAATAEAAPSSAAESKSASTPPANQSPP